MEKTSSTDMKLQRKDRKNFDTIVSFTNFVKRMEMQRKGIIKNHSEKLNGKEVIIDGYTQSKCWVKFSEGGKEYCFLKHQVEERKSPEQPS